MAKKPKKPKEDKIKKELEGDLNSASQFNATYFPMGPLQHYLDPLQQEKDNFRNLRLATSDPHSEVFAGRMSADTLLNLNRLRDESDPNSANFVGKSSNDINDIIERFKGGLEGYTAAENNALRESASRGLDANAADLRYKRMRSNAAGRVRGAAAQAGMAGIDRDRQQQGMELEQDIFLKNADEKRSRLMDYSSLVRSVDDTNYTRRQSAFKDFRDFQDQEERESYDRGRTALGDYENTLGGQSAERFQIGQFNIGQDEKTQTRDVGNVLGLAGLLGTKRSEERQNKILGKR